MCECLLFILGAVCCCCDCGNKGKKDKVKPEKPCKQDDDCKKGCRHDRCEKQCECDCECDYCCMPSRFYQINGIYSDCKQVRYRGRRFYEDTGIYY